MFWRKRRKIKDHNFLLGIDIDPGILIGPYELGKSIRKMCEDFLEKDACRKITVSVYFDNQLSETLTLKKEADI
jgi:hypothetical protein